MTIKNTHSLKFTKVHFRIYLDVFVVIKNKVSVATNLLTWDLKFITKNHIIELFHNILNRWGIFLVKEFKDLADAS